MRNRIWLAVAGVGVIAASIVVAQEGQKPAGQPEFELPPGMTQEDVMACMEAAMPGPMHQWLTEQEGVWHGKTKMWMAPDSEPMVSECTSTITTMMDGRFTRCEIAGEMPGMGAFSGFGLYGYDNVAEEFQCTWIDNMGTGMMRGTGELSSDKKTLTWEFTYNCPMTGKPKTMREVQRRTGENTATLEMYGQPPQGGEEYKMMEITLKRKQATAAAGAQ